MQKKLNLLEEIEKLFFLFFLSLALPCECKYDFGESTSTQVMMSTSVELRVGGTEACASCCSVKSVLMMH